MWLRGEGRAEAGLELRDPRHVFEETVLYCHICRERKLGVRKGVIMITEWRGGDQKVVPNGLMRIQQPDIVQQVTIQPHQTCNFRIELPPNALIEHITGEAKNEFGSANRPAGPFQGCPIDGGECGIGWSHFNSAPQIDDRNPQRRAVLWSFYTESHDYPRTARVAVSYSTY